MSALFSTGFGRQDNFDAKLSGRDLGT